MKNGQLLTSTIFAVVLTLALPQLTYAFGDAGDAGDGGCCGLPPELEQRGRELEDSFSATNSADLATQKWAGSICQNHPCNGEVTEDQAKDLLLDFQARQERNGDRWLSWFGIVLSALSAIAALYALRQTHHSEKLAREADVRSIRSEARLDQLKEE